MFFKEVASTHRLIASERPRARRVVPILVVVIVAVMIGGFVAFFPAGFSLRVLLPLVALSCVILSWAYRAQQNDDLHSTSSVALIALVSLSVLWPRYLFVHKFGLPGVNPLTLMTMLCLGLCVCLLLFSTNASARVGAVYRQGEMAATLVITFFAWQLFASAVGEEALYSTIGQVKEFVYVGSFFLFGLYLSGFERGPQNVLRAFIFCGFIVALIAIYEGAVHRNPFVGFIQIADGSDSAMALAGIAADKARDGQFRAQSTFDHPIVFAQFVAALIPLCFFAMRYERRWFWRVVAALAMPVAVVAIIKSGSRSGYVSLAVSLVAIGTVWWLRTLVHGRRLKPIAIMALPALVLGMATAMVVVSELVAGRTRIEASSSNVRLKMLSDGVAALWDSPIWGFGHGLALSKAGVVNPFGLATIDSYWLTIAIDYGYMGLLIFFALIATFTWKGLVFSVKTQGREGAFVGACISSVLALFATFAAVSIYQNMTMMWLLMAISFPVWAGRQLDDRPIVRA